METDHTCKLIQTEKVPETSETVQTMSTTTHATSGGVAAAAVAISLMSMSSPTVLWLMVNQMQLYMLLLLIKSAIPQDVEAYITSNDFMSFSLDFIPIVDLRKFISYILKL